MNEYTEEKLPVNRLDLFFITQAYNRGEISLEKWQELTKAWAEAMHQLHGPPVTPPQKPVEPD